MKLKDRDLEAVVLRVTKYKLPTRIVALQFKISQRPVHQIARLSKTTGEIPKNRRPGRRPYAVYPVDLRAEIIQAKLNLDLSASVNPYSAILFNFFNKSFLAKFIYF